MKTAPVPQDNWVDEALVRWNSNGQHLYREMIDTSMSSIADMKPGASSQDSELLPSGARPIPLVSSTISASDGDLAAPSIRQFENMYHLPWSIRIRVHGEKDVDVPTDTVVEFISPG